MAVSNPLICNFNAGELSPLLYGRSDLDKYKNGCKLLENFIPLPYGPAKRREGTEYIGEILGTERVTYGDFSSSDGWVMGTGWAIVGGVATATPTASQMYRPTDCTPGREYLVTYTINSVSAGSVNAFLGGTALTSRTAAGTYIERAIYGSSAYAGFSKSSQFVGEIDNFSIREVNPINVLIAFEFSTIQAYILEFTEKQIRFYKDGGIILNDEGNPYTLETPYLEDDLASLHVTQSADTMYIAHPSYAPRKLLRYAHNEWVLATITFLGAPTKTITGADKTDPVKVYCPEHGLADEDQVSIWGVEGMTQINGYFVATDCKDSEFDLRGINGTGYGAYTGGGILLKIKRPITDATQANPVVITLAKHGFANGDRIRIFNVAGMTELNEVSFTVANRTEDTFELEGIDGTAYTAYTSGGDVCAWPELFEEEDHYPSSAEFFEERLIWVATNQKPQTLFGSKSGDYENLGIGAEDDDAFIYTIAAKGVNPIQWIAAMDKLLIGTKGGEWVMKSSGADEAVTPSNVSIKRESTWGSSNIQALVVNDVILFVQRGGTKIRELVYDFEDIRESGYVAPDLTILSEHITEGGITEIRYQQEPYSLVWAVRADGVLLLMVYERTHDVVGWARLTTTGKFKSVAVITTDTTDEVWVSVEREVEGSNRLYVERFGGDYCLDSFMIWDGGGTTDITDITKTDEEESKILVTAPSHPCEDGDHVRFAGVEGMATLNDYIYVVSDKTENTFLLKDNEGDYIDSGDYEDYTGSGTVEVVAKTFSGIEHLVGKEVDMVGEGYALEAATVESDGTLALEEYVGSLVLGLGCPAYLSPMDLEAGGQVGTAQGKIKRIHKAVIRFKDTQSCCVKTADGTWEEIEFRSDSDPADAPVPQFTGDKTVSVYPGDYGLSADITLGIFTPFPATIIAIFPELKTMDVL